MLVSVADNFVAQADSRVSIKIKSYQIGEPITVTVTPEKFEITSLPGPDRTITDDDISNRRMVSRRYRNRRIGDFLKELKLVEGRNTGIPTILRAMARNGSALPVFETDEERTYFTVILPVHQMFTSMESLKTESQKKVRRSVANIRRLIFDVLVGNSEKSSSELAAAMGYTKVTDAVGKAIRELLNEQKIVYLDPDCRWAPCLAELFFTTHGGTSVENSATPVHNVPPNRHRQWEIQIVHDYQKPFEWRYDHRRAFYWSEQHAGYKSVLWKLAILYRCISTV